jgi:sugar lactone lactonase YvrE
MRFLTLLAAIALAAGLTACNGGNTTPIVLPKILWVGTCGNAPVGIFTYLAGGSGTSNAQLSAITGANTQISCVEGIAFDSAGNIYDADCGNKIIVFAAGAAGNVAPLRTITSVSCPVGVTFDSSGNLVVGDFNLSKVLFFAPGASGAAVPIKFIDVTAAGLLRADSVRFDTSGNLWVSDESGNKIAEYPPGASGAAASIALISGGNTGLNGSLGMVLDGSNGIYVANDGTPNLEFFNAASNGNVFPNRVISGGNTGLVSPLGVMLDNAGNLYAANCPNSTSGNVTVYPATSTGNVTPSRTIPGLNCPWGLAVR